VPSRSGSPNKLKATLLARLDAKFPGWHPVVQMAEIANDDTQTIELRFNAAKEVAKYVTPQLKAVEVTGDETSPLQVTVRIVPHA
jgi:hypothetical protein